MEDPRNLGACCEVSGHSGPLGTQKMAFPAELGPDFDPNTILQTQDRLTQDYEGLQVLLEVMFHVLEMLTEHTLCARPWAVSPGTE